MSHRGLSETKTEYLEIGEYNFTWPGENGSLHDFGAINYTMPSGELLLIYISIINIKRPITCIN